MNDAVKPRFSKDLSHPVRVADISLDEPVISLGEVTGNICVFDRRIVKIVKVVNDRYLPSALGEQVINEMRTNEPGSAGYKYIFIH